MPAFVALALCAAAAAPALGQIDYRNLDDDRPVRVEDAYPVERFAFELLLPYSVERGRGGVVSHAVVPELVYGLAANLQVGLKLPLAVVDTGAAGATLRGLAGLRAFALYNFNTEGTTLPALSLRLDGYAAAGRLGGDGARGSVKLIATRSFGRNRIHLNGAYGFGDQARRAAVEGGDRWWYGAAVDRTLYRQSVLVVAEAFAARGDYSEAVEVRAAAGFRWQWTPTTVMDVGFSRSLRAESDPEVAFTVGFSHAFAIAALMPGRAPAVTPQGGSDAHRH